MRKAILIAILLFSTLVANSQDTPHFGEAVRQELSRPFYPGETMRSESVAREAAMLGWGTSRWDKGEFVSGMTKEELERKRAIERNAYYKRFFTIVGISLCIVAIIFLSYKIIINYKRKRNPFSDSSFSSDY